VASKKLEEFQSTRKQEFSKGGRLFSIKLNRMMLKINSRI
jgi:hypothetical protein